MRSSDPSRGARRRPRRHRPAPASEVPPRSIGTKHRDRRSLSPALGGRRRRSRRTARASHSPCSTPIGPERPYTRIWTADRRGEDRGTIRRRDRRIVAALVAGRQAPGVQRVDGRRQERHRRSPTPTAPASNRWPTSWARIIRCRRSASGWRGRRTGAASRSCRRCRARAGDGSRSDRDHALLVSTRFVRRRPIQRQSPSAPVRRRRRHEAGAPAHRRHQFRALDRLVTGRQAAGLPVESRARSRLLLQLRHLRARRRLGRRTTADDDEEQRVRAGVVAGRPARSPIRDSNGRSPRPRRTWKTRTSGRSTSPPASAASWAPTSTTGRAGRSGHPTARSLYFTVQSRGSVKLHRLPGGRRRRRSSWCPTRTHTRSRRQLRGREGRRGRLRADDARRDRRSSSSPARPARRR